MSYGVIGAPCIGTPNTGNRARIDEDFCQVTVRTSAARFFSTALKNIHNSEYGKSATKHVSTYDDGEGSCWPYTY